MIANLLEAPSYKVEDRRAILKRVLAFLLKSDDCRYNFKGPWVRLTPEEEGNWQARCAVVHCLEALPAPSTALPFAPVEAEYEEPVADPTV